MEEVQMINEILFPKRKYNRLKNYDYNSYGLYFLTICTKDRKCLLSRIVGGGVLDAPYPELTEKGQIVKKWIDSMNGTYATVKTVKYVIMPNHIHLLVSVTENTGSVHYGPSGTPAPTNALIPRYISTLKRMCNRDAGTVLWQRSYHDHVIREEKDFQRIWQYIDTNPVRWEQDCFYMEE